MADHGGLTHVGYRNPRSGTFHKLKLDLYPGPDWQKLYIGDPEVLAAEHEALVARCERLDLRRHELDALLEEAERELDKWLQLSRDTVVAIETVLQGDHVDIPNATVGDILGRTSAALRAALGDEQVE